MEAGGEDKGWFKESFEGPVKELTLYLIDDQEAQRQMGLAF